MGKIVTVDFHNDTLFAIERDDGVFLAIKPICDRFGLAWNKQLERLKRDTILAEGMTMMGIPSAGGTQETVLLRLDLVNGWLFGIDESRIKDEATRQLVLTYKRECYAALFRRFFGRGIGGETGTPPASERPVFPDWPLDEFRMKSATVRDYRAAYGVMAAQWIMPQLGYPVPPPHLIENGRQLTMTFSFPAGSTP